MTRRGLPLLLSRTANSLGPLLLLLTWLLGDGGILLLLALGAALAVAEHFYRFSADRLPSPSLVLALAPLLLLHYSSVADFRIRLACFFMLSVILILAPRRPVKPPRFTLATARPWQVWLLSFLALAAAAVVLYSQRIHLSGDEPHYIIVAQSLVEDGDFDLKNNLDPGKYSYLHAGGNPFPRLGKRRPLSFLPSARECRSCWFPFFILFKLLNGAVPGHLYFRLVAAFINSFFALGLFLALRRQPGEKEERRLFIFFLVTFPLVFQAVHLFPELPGAALVVFAYLSARDKKRYFTAGLLLAGVPWLHLKYSLPIVFLSLAVLAWIWLETDGVGARLKRLAAFAAAPLASLALLLLYSKVLYGSFSPTAIEAQFAEKSFFAVPIGLRIETLSSFSSTSATACWCTPRFSC